MEEVDIWRLIGTAKNAVIKEIVDDFVRYNDTDIDGAAFKIGENVTVFRHSAPVATGIVIAVGENEDTYEYAVDTYPYLVWENELKLSQQQE